jgi:ATP-dependent helicase/nuclease subunit B
MSATPMPWAGEDGAAASKLLERLDELGLYLNDMAPEALVDLIETEAAAQNVRMGGAEHPRLKIWNPLEARLQTADLVILAGLNEGVWPERVPPDAFLPARFRKTLHLPHAEERMGLSAHDFAQLASAPNVVLLHAARRDDAPAVDSRWLWRLRTLVEAAAPGRSAETLGAGQSQLKDWVTQVQGDGLSQPGAGPAKPPQPRKRPKDWPRRLSVTRIDRLQRDPYSIWAEDILRLRTIDPMNAAVDARLRGTAIHKAIERFELEPGERSPGRLSALLGETMLAGGEPEASVLSRHAIWEDVAAWYIDWLKGRDTRGGVALEASGQLKFNIANAPFVLSAQADRIERHDGGTVSIIDFKSGAAPSDKMIATGLSQQMPLQAVIARASGFGNLPASEVASLVYVEFKRNGGERLINKDGKHGTLAEMVAKAEAGVVRLISDYRSTDGPFLSAPRVQFIDYDYGYNLLARRAEWTSDASDGGGNDDGA